MIRGRNTLIGTNYPKVLIDDILFDYGDPDSGFTILDMIQVTDIAQIDVLKGPETAIFGAVGNNGVIVIYTKRGVAFNDNTPQFHIKSIIPLGHQQPVEFYAPKYETETQRNNPKPDLRTTIHWQPIVQTNDKGVASFAFYTADEQTSYTVIIEGLANDGSIIRQEGKLFK